MAVSTVTIESSRPTLARSGPAFKLPNPGDVFILTAFGWAAVCFFMVTIGNRLFSQLARLSASTAIRDVLLENQSAIAVIMVAGLIGIAIGYFLLVRYPRFLLFSLLVGVTFGAAGWSVIHDPAFLMRYMVIVYLGVFGAIFFLQNFWKIIATPYYRLVLLYLAWIGLVVLVNGFRIRDIWYLATEFTFMLALGLAWISRVDSPERLREFNKLVAYIAIPVTLLHMISPLVYENAVAGGRFQSYSSRPTGFAIVYSLFVVPLFWLSMYEKRKLVRQTATVFALIGMVLILLSGTRNATVATLIGIGVLWWVFRTRIFVYFVALAMVGLVVQILLSGDENIEFVSSRLQSTENTRLEAWALYARLTAESPLLGYGYDGLRSAVYGAQLVDFVSRFAAINVPGVHNYYLGLAVRFGIPALLLSLAIHFFAFRTAWRVVFSRIVSEEDKKLYILPAAMLTVMAAEGLFEDTMGSTGKGALHGIVFGICAYLMVVYGNQLLANAEQHSRQEESDSAPVESTV